MSELTPPTPNRRTLPHGIPPWVKPGSLYFLTLCGRPRGVNQFCQPGTAPAIFKSVANRQESETWFVRVLVLMPDHLHLLVAFAPDHSLVNTVRLWKAYLARHAGIKWQRDFFEHRVRDGKALEEKAGYIRANPVRAGLIASGEPWPYTWEP